MDDADLRIIQELVANARVTYRALADRLGLSVNSVHKRVQHMAEQGIIQQFTLHLTPRAIPQVWVRVCGASATKLMDETVERLGKNPDTSMVAVSSNNVLHVVGVLRDFTEISQFVDFVVRAGEIEKPDIRLPNPPLSPGIADVALTGTDYRILAALRENSRKQIVRRGDGARPGGKDGTAASRAHGRERIDHLRDQVRPRLAGRHLHVAGPVREKRDRSPGSPAAHHE